MSPTKEIPIIDEEEAIEVSLPSPLAPVPGPAPTLTQSSTPPTPSSLLSLVVEVSPLSPLAQVGASASKEAPIKDKELIEMVAKMKQFASVF